MQSTGPYAVVVEADRALGLSLRHMFTVICGLRCDLYVEPGDVVEQISAEQAPKVIILGRPLLGREDILRQIKDSCDSFVIVLNYNDEEFETENAFLAGADDVVQVPFSLREFALRLRARIGMMRDTGADFLFRDAKGWDSEAYIAERAGLTDSEAQVAHILISHNGTIVSRDALSQAIDGKVWEYGDRKFDVHVAKIRKKLIAAFGEHISVETVRSAGYVLRLDEIGYEALREISQ